MREQVAAGRQAFVVCPLVEDSAKLEAASATAEFERLKGVFPELRLGLVHGQLPAEEKRRAMQAFRDGAVEFRQTYSSFAPVDPLVYSSPDGSISIRFPSPHSVVSQAMVYAVKAVGRSGAESAEEMVTIFLYSREFYAAHGLTTGGVITFDSGGLRFAGSQPDDWIVDVPSLRDVQFAQGEWGAALAGIPTPSARARALAGAILQRISSRQGTPSDAMASASPFDRYTRAISGLDLVDSESLASIFSHACNCLGIPARRVEMEKVLSRGADYDLLATESRAAVEIFDRKENRWAWFDLSSGVLGIELHGYGLLNTVEVSRAVADPALSAGLTTYTYDVDARAPVQMPFASAPTAGAIWKYFSGAPRIRYAQRAP